MKIIYQVILIAVVMMTAFAAAPVHASLNTSSGDPAATKPEEPGPQLAGRAAINGVGPEHCGECENSKTPATTGQVRNVASDKTNHFKDAQLITPPAAQKPSDGSSKSGKPLSNSLVHTTRSVEI